MAENEYLDISKSHRWHQVYDAVRDGKPIDQVVDLCEIALRKVIKNPGKPLFVGGDPQVPLGDFLRTLPASCFASEAVRDLPRVYLQATGPPCRGD